MVKLLTILALIFAVLSFTVLPWVAAVLYTALSVLQPQYVWFWAYEGIPAFNVVAGVSLVSWVVQAIQKKIDYSVYALPINKALFALTFFVNLSDWVASYAGGIGSEMVLEIFNTTMLMYFCCLPLINNEKAVHYITLVFIITAVYYGYDANDAYFSSDWSRFAQGRLIGPLNGAYNDNNKFAIIMVIGFPFLLLGFFHYKNLIIKLLMLAGMAMSLHGIFLTSSRGALIAIGAAVFICTRVLNFSGFKKTFINLAILGGFAFVVLDQAGGTIARSTGLIDDNRITSEEAINPRIVSWTVGMKLIKKHPIFGVGVMRFRMASAMEFPGESPHVAHNTFITFSTENGLISGLLYLYTFWASFIMLRKINRHVDKNSLYRYSANSAFAALGGFFVGAIFLDMVVYEPYYFLLMLLTACYVHVLKLEKSSHDVPDKTQAPQVSRQ